MKINNKHLLILIGLIGFIYDIFNASLVEIITNPIIVLCTVLFIKNIDKRFENWLNQEYEI